MEHGASRRDLTRAREAVSYWRDFRRYGWEGAKPHDGGRHNQPVEWLRALDCVQDARDDADAEHDKMERQARENVREVGIDELVGRDPSEVADDIARYEREMQGFG